MPRSVVVEQSRAIPIAAEDAFRRTLPLPQVFTSWYGPIPPIKGVREQTGEWDGVGQTRVVLSGGGGSAREGLTSVKWVIHAGSGVTAHALPTLGRVWQGYARRTLETLSDLLVA